MDKSDYCRDARGLDVNASALCVLDGGLTVTMTPPKAPQNSLEVNRNGDGSVFPANHTFEIELTQILNYGVAQVTQDFTITTMNTQRKAIDLAPIGVSHNTVFNMCVVCL